jgi:predicted porin
MTSTINSNQYAKRTAQEVGVRGYATKTIEYWGSIGNGRYTSMSSTTVANPTANITGYQVGSNYWMSKRTNLYAIYGANNTSNTTSATIGSANLTQYSVGVRHTF